MSSRISQKFNELKKKNKKALITYVTAGDPDINTTEQLVYAMENAGADIIELGIAYSDPLADGPVIQRAASRALNKGVNIDIVFELVRKLRTNTQVPLAFLLYYNSIYRYGIDKFINKCMEAGVDGLIIPDLPLEERTDFKKILDGKNIDLIPLVAPTSEMRIKDLVKDATGFIYCVSSLGVTGARNSFDSNIKEFMDNIKLHTDVPLAIGFGISDVQGVKQLKDLAQGLIVGSAIIKKIEEGIVENKVVNLVSEFVKELRDALN
ncbi:tryptophan synthase subunit alpha [Alkalibaculum sp. M08DMB]|uniref:Tryptophan synthase alpha chain n=1 Tax=Alkalibaculum sporogenes TaxID=2655001 RepID=A0A6A7KB04_9FIRM|nr:tryptophan synthase subunit alpha [Alkalibaculum sporogenes]MPW26710.1 tryptophan synthase subunit alpha [Alkalibaculum sporogenes]